ncbi:MAG: hypothetical protein JWN99_2557 [Ilumatobacteraceae bacterium]|nr:hypothetical protein [Ilumatobacteraceae bacterium]
MTTARAMNIEQLNSMSAADQQRISDWVVDVGVDPATIDFVRIDNDGAAHFRTAPGIVMASLDVEVDELVEVPEHWTCVPDAPEPPCWWTPVLADIPIETIIEAVDGHVPEITGRT